MKFTADAWFTAITPMFRQVLVAIGILAVAGFIAVGVAVGVPYYQREKDRPQKAKRYAQVQGLMDALYYFSELHPEKRFPTNLFELYAFPLGTLATNTLLADQEAVSRDFTYFPPPFHTRNDFNPRRLIVAEQLGHYRYASGAYVGVTGNLWCDPATYHGLRNQP